MKNYRLKNIHLEKNDRWEIFVAIWWVYDESSNWFSTLTNNEIIDLLNDSIINSSREERLNKQQFRSSLSDFSTKL